MSADLTVAKTILTQLGGARFTAMTGARDFLGGSNLLSFKVPMKTRNKSNRVRITLDPSDTYTVEFVRVSGVNSRLISKHEGVYADQLQELFTAETGLYTRL